MKKLFALLLAGLLLLSACGETDSKKEEPKKEESKAEQTKVEEPKKEEPKKEEKPEETKSEETKPEPGKGGEIKLGEPIVFEDFIITIKGFKVIKDYEKKDLLVVNYAWENTSDKETMPFVTFGMKGFQDGVETEDRIHMAEGLDLGIGQKEVKPKGKIKEAQDAISIDDMKKPLDIELSELISFDDVKYTYTIEDLSKLK